MNGIPTKLHSDHFSKTSQMRFIFSQYSRYIYKMKCNSEGSLIFKWLNG